MKIIALLFFVLLFKISSYSQSTVISTETDKLESKTTYSYPKGEWFSENLRPIMQKNKFGFEDKKGIVRIPIIYDDVQRFENSVAIVKKNKKYGVITSKNKIIFPIDYDFIWYFRNGYSYLKKGGKNALITSKGKYLTQLVLDEVRIDASMDIFVSGLAYVSKDQKWGVVDSTGQTIIPFEYDQIQTATDSFMVVKKNQKVGFIDLKNHIRIPLIYDAATPFSDGYSIVTKKGFQSGIIDKQGNQVVTIEYDYLSSHLSEGVRNARKNGKNGFIDSIGKIIIPFVYDWADPDGFRKDKIKVEKDGARFYINKKGERL